MPDIEVVVLHLVMVAMHVLHSVLALALTALSDESRCRDYAITTVLTDLALTVSEDIPLDSCSVAQRPIRRLACLRGCRVALRRCWDRSQSDIGLHSESLLFLCFATFFVWQLDVAS